jgi:glucose-6-phosphate isomerase
MVFHRHMALMFQHQTDLAFPADLAKRAEGETAFAANLAALGSAMEELRSPSDPELASVLSVPDELGDLARLEAIAANWRGQFDDVVILGTGGSSLGGRALTKLASHRKGPRVKFLDNLDPHTLDRWLATSNLAKTGVVVISKSGGTPDTLVLTLVIAAALRKRSQNHIANQFLVICQPGENPLRSWAQSESISVIDHDPNLGGRFSVLSVVGMLPALMAGLDARAARQGAAEVLAQARAATEPANSAPAVGAALSVALMRACDLPIVVMMPYADRLAPFALWHRQLWAESLGKNGLGSTPLHALGPVDQHSQLQLYLDGPADKFFTLMMVAANGAGPKVPEATAAKMGAAYLAGVTVGDLVAAQQDATAKTLAANARPVRIFELPTIDERAMGGLFMHFMLETILAARLLGVNPFGQPAVEQGKEIARHSLARISKVES